MSKEIANPGALAGEQLISIASPFGGWVSPLSSVSASPHYVAAIEGVEAPTFGKQNLNQYSESSGVTLFKYEKFSHLAPGNGFSVTTDGSNYITDVPINGYVESNAQLGVLVLKNGRVTQIANGGASTTAKYDPTAHTGTSSSNGDMILFRDYASTINEWVVWSWGWGGPNPQTNCDIAIVKASNLTSPTDNWYSGLSGATALRAEVPHKLCAGPDGNIYVTDGPVVRQILVASGSALTAATIGNVLNLGSGWTATSICAYKNYTAIIASDKISNFSYGKTRVFLWDGTATTNAGVTSVAPQFIFDIPDNFGNGLYFDGDTLFAFTNGRNNSSKIWEFTGRGFKKVFETPFINSSVGSLQGSIDHFQDGLILTAIKGDSLGHLFRFYGGGFHDEGYISDGDNLTANIATTVGMCKNLFTNIYFVGVKYGSTYKLFYSNPSSYQTCTATSGSFPNTIDFRTILYTAGILGRRQYPLGFKMSVTRIKLFLSQWGTGSSLFLSAFNGYDACLPGSTVATGGVNDLLRILIDTDSTKANGFISGANKGGYSTGYYHYCYPVGTYEIDLSDIGITDVSSFYMNIRWTHSSPSNTPAIIRRGELHVSQSQ